VILEITNIDEFKRRLSNITNDNFPQGIDLVECADEIQIVSRKTNRSLGRISEIATFSNNPKKIGISFDIL
jgi:hypothetical protein